MLTFEEVKQAFEKAIKMVGLDQFKSTSIFVSNAREEEVIRAKKAA